MRQRLRNIPWFSTKLFKLDGLIGPFADCVWCGICQCGFIDSKMCGGVYKMQVRCVSGLLEGQQIWLDWDTEVVRVDAEAMDIGVPEFVGAT